ncbi:hypothetical protein OG689_42510 [Kitasatospora sp. NBC_00240]|uniref:hypothetical protein n=1 Tax=Kitasatospora sp. NBC_00240 TaxID=2903567 RepID=UPI00224E0134|nr:hypothetical protein [Kitasatospora sp. NBC_00240]MCX5215825.1 hypothetical protein [Kitasatospora sp. NBC_00240]
MGKRAAIALAPVGLAGVVFVLLWRGPWLLDNVEFSRTDRKLDAPQSTVVSGFRTALVVAAAGIGGLFFTAKTLRTTQATLAHTRGKDRAQEELTRPREGQVTERYVKAVGLLTDEDSATAQLAGVYALQRIMRDSEKDHDTIVQLLAGFVRERSPWASSAGTPRVKAPSDIQAALTLLATRPDRPEVDRIDLSPVIGEGEGLGGMAPYPEGVAAKQQEGARPPCSASVVPARIPGGSIFVSQ